MNRSSEHPTVLHSLESTVNAADRTSQSPYIQEATGLMAAATKLASRKMEEGFRLVPSSVEDAILHQCYHHLDH